MRVDALVAQQLADLRQRRAAAQQLGRDRVTQPVSADPRESRPVARPHDHRTHRAGRQLVIRRASRQHQPTAEAARATVAKVIDQRFTDIDRQSGKTSCRRSLAARSRSRRPASPRHRAPTPRPHHDAARAASAASGSRNRAGRLRLSRSQLASNMLTCPPASPRGSPSRRRRTDGTASANGVAIQPCTCRNRSNDRSAHTIVSAERCPRWRASRNTNA